ncbi:MAG: methyltransferase domain-containing protein [Actinomycetota bacterium]|nr:methyltransferase domain-containing protein [Actinomycetota bacterium]
MNTTTSTSIDVGRQEAFGERMLEVLNDAMLGMLLSVGHRTGLFDRLAQLPPSTSQQVADAAGLDERYVREWLGGMTVARIVEYDPTAATFRLPPEHASFLTRAAGPDNLAFFMQYLALIGQVEDEVVDAFRTGGGVAYSSYPTFQRLQAEETARIFDAALVNTIIPLAPGLPERLQAGIDVVDVGCGQGHAINLLAQAFPASRFTGIDISEEGIAAGRTDAAERGLTNVRFEVQDAAALEGSYDVVFAYDVIHDLARPDEVLKAIARSLRPDGVFLMVDITASSHLEENLDHPLGPTLYAFSIFYCMTTSLAQGGAGLGTVWGEQTAQRMLADAGFTDVNIEHVEGDILNVYYICRR